MLKIEGVYKDAREVYARLNGAEVSKNGFYDNKMIEITEIREKDINSLRSLFLKTRRIAFSCADISQFKLSDFEEQTKDEYILVALADERVAGFISVWTADNFIHHLYVDEQFQNQNVGTQLLKAVCDKFGLPIRLKCEENNSKAVCFYRRKGFKEKGSGKSEIGTYILFELNRKIE